MIINISEVYDVIQSAMEYRRNLALTVLRKSEREEKYRDTLQAYSLYIPKKYARGEDTSDTVWTYENAKEVDNYEIILPHQVGSFYTRRDTIVLYKINKNNHPIYIKFVLYPDGGIDVDRDDHTTFLRYTDEKDRRIIKGFIYKYASYFIDICHDENIDERDLFYIRLEAARWKYTKSIKRVNMGPSNKGEGNYDFYNKVYGYKPYEESTIFTNVSFI